MSTSATADSSPHPESAPRREPPQPPARRNPHLHGTTKSMIWSTLAVTALVLVFYALVVRPDQVVRPVVDVRGVVGEARRATGWQLGTVEGLGAGWAPTVARLEPAADGLRTWQVRYVEGEHHYVALTQTARATPGWIDGQVKGRPSAGAVRVGPVPLDSFASAAGCTLVRRGGEGLTSVIETGESCDRAMAYAAKVTPALR
ncbi:DUF4245 family protein [Arsenicicoccus dermatophilus]|uniref:DUF4245 family protein n=1 Tax=Arsenicicoccus dermatophilus TaxID=1076331 RepID=UPI00391706FF